MKLTLDQAQAAMPRWWGPTVSWAARWAMRGTRWVPLLVRRIPLHFLCTFARWRLLLLLRGYGGCGPHGDA
jgi:hypothetical protein